MQLSFVGWKCIIIANFLLMMIITANYMHWVIDAMRCNEIIITFDIKYHLHCQTEQTESSLRWCSTSRTYVHNSVESVTPPYMASRILFFCQININLYCIFSLRFFTGKSHLKSDFDEILYLNSLQMCGLFEQR